MKEMMVATSGRGRGGGTRLGAAPVAPLPPGTERRGSPRLQVGQGCGALARAGPKAGGGRAV